MCHMLDAFLMEYLLHNSYELDSNPILSAGKTNIYLDIRNNNKPIYVCGFKVIVGFAVKWHNASK